MPETEVQPTWHTKVYLGLLQQQTWVQVSMIFRCCSASRFARSAHEPCGHDHQGFALYKLNYCWHRSACGVSCQVRWIAPLTRWGRLAWREEAGQFTRKWTLPNMITSFVLIVVLCFSGASEISGAATRAAKVMLFSIANARGKTRLEGEPG